MKCIERARRPDGALCSYSGYLVVGDLTAEVSEQIQAAASAAGLQVDVTDTAIEFEYNGRDTNQFVVEFLRTLAKCVGTANGEIRCEVTSDGDDPAFEFYRMSHGRLIRQLAQVIRGSENDISDCSADE